MTRREWMLAGLGVALGAEARGQSPAPPPVLSETQQAIIAAHEAKIDAAQAKLTVAQLSLERVVREAQDYLRAQQREGYDLSRGENGRWAYQRKEQ